LRIVDKQAPDWQASLSLHPVNVVEACQPAGGRNLAAAHSKWRSWRILKHPLCFGINRAAQNGSRSAL